MTSSTPTPKIGWQGSSWRLLIQPVQLPDGGTIEKGIIDHPGAVVMVPLRETAAGPEVIMLRQYRLALDETILELPAGTRDRQEDWLACAQRELREETGYRADHFQALGRCWPTPGLSNEIMAIFLATGLHCDPLPQDSDEIIDTQPILLDNLLKMALDGQLQDAKSVVGILRTAFFLQSGFSISK
jgi:ADP-ribose pyrophosphatase